MKIKETPYYRQLLDEFTPEEAYRMCLDARRRARLLAKECNLSEEQKAKFLAYADEAL